MAQHANARLKFPKKFRALMFFHLEAEQLAKDAQKLFSSHSSTGINFSKQAEMEVDVKGEGVEGVESMDSLKVSCGHVCFRKSLANA